VFEVILHKQQRAVRQHPGQRCLQVFAADLAYAGGARNRGYHLFRGRDNRKRDPHDAVPEIVLLAAGDCQAEPSLTRTTRTRERQQADVRSSEQLFGLGKLAFAAHQRGARSRSSADKPCTARVAVGRTPIISGAVVQD